MTSALVSRQVAFIGEVGASPRCVRVEFCLHGPPVCRLNTQVFLSALAYDQHVL
jgi:hypothetical protein